MSDDKCPKCGSRKVWVGAMPLSCDDCGWHYLNEYPCDVCGKPANSTMGTGRWSIYRCSEHPISDKELSDGFERIASEIIRQKSTE